LVGSVTLVLERAEGVGGAIRELDGRRLMLNERRFEASRVGCGTSRGRGCLSIVMQSGEHALIVWASKRERERKEEMEKAVMCI
jgi:hypothetical protein